MDNGNTHSHMVSVEVNVTWTEEITGKYLSNWQSIQKREKHILLRGEEQNILKIYKNILNY